MKTYDLQFPTPQGPADRPQQTFLIGISFHEAAIRCADEHRDENGVPIKALCPMIVSYAFAAELYLKSAGSGRVKGHRLDVLYGKLPGSLRAAIAVVYQRRTGRNERELTDDLKGLARAFEDWRYVFEGEGQQIRTNILVAFVWSLYHTLRTVFPEWPVPEGQDCRLRSDERNPTMLVANLGGGTFVEVVDGTGELNSPTA